MTPLILMASGPIAPATAAEAKPVPAATVLPAVPLGAQQLADIAAKGIPSAPAPVLTMPAMMNRNLHPEGPSAGLERIAARDPWTPTRHLPAISEAMGLIPRDSWIRAALGKRPDVAVVGGRLVPVVTSGGGPR